jgi:hypothetical protein
VVKKTSANQVGTLTLAVVILCIIALKIFTSLTKATGNDYYSHLQPSTDPTSDRTSALLTAWYFSKMTSPWSTTTLLNYPEGESIFRWQELTQLFQIGILFLFSKICSPSISVSLLTLVGLSLSCFSLYRLTKVLTTNQVAGMFAPIVLLLSPYTDRIISTHTSESFLGLSVLSLSYAFEINNKNNVKIFIKMYFALVFVAIVDGYYFLFSLFATFILIACQLARYCLRRKYPPKYLTMSLLVLVAHFMIVKALSTYLQKKGSANAQIASLDSILSHKADTNYLWLGNVHTFFFGEYLTYRPTGPVIGMFALGVTIIGFLKFRYRLFDIAIVTMVLQVLGTYSSPRNPLTQITATLKTLFPGVLYYSRFTHVVFCLTVSMYVYVIYQASQSWKTRMSKVRISNTSKKMSAILVVTVMVTLVMYDWSGERDRFKYYVQERPQVYQSLSATIAGNGTAIFPLDIFGRSHIEQFYLQTNLANSKRRPEELQDIWNRAISTKSIKKELLSESIRFLILFSRNENSSGEYVFSWERDGGDEVIIDLPELEANIESRFPVLIYGQKIYVNLFDLQKSNPENLD